MEEGSPAEDEEPIQEEPLYMESVEVKARRGASVTLRDLVVHPNLMLVAAEVPAYGRIALEGCVWAKWIVDPKEFSAPYLILYPQAGGGFQAIIRVQDGNAGGKYTYLISEVCKTHPAALQDLKVKLGLVSPESSQKTFRNDFQAVRRYRDIFAREGQVETRIDDVDPVVLAHHLLNIQLPSSIPSLSCRGAVIMTKTDNPYYVVTWPSQGGRYQGIGVQETTGKIVVTGVFTNLQQALECGHATVLQIDARHAHVS